MSNYQVTLSEAEDKALSFVAYSQNNWIQNAVHERCRLAIEDIVKICVEKCLENNVQIPSSKDEMVLLSFSNGWVKTAKETTDETLAVREATSGA